MNSPIVFLGELFYRNYPNPPVVIRSSFHRMAKRFTPNSGVQLQVFLFAPNPISLN